MLNEVRRSFADADVILVLAEANLPWDRALPALWNEYKKIAGEKPMVLALSKSDLLKDRKSSCFPFCSVTAIRLNSKSWFLFLPLRDYNIKELVATLRKYLPGTEPFFDSEQLSDQNDRFFAGELIREAIFQKFKEEIPYSTEVEITEFKEREAGKWFVGAEVIVERDTQKSILIGKNGMALKSLGEQPERDRTVSGSSCLSRTSCENQNGLAAK